MIRGWARELDAWLIKHHRPLRELTSPERCLTRQLANKEARVRPMSSCFSISYTSSLCCRYITPSEALAWIPARQITKLPRSWQPQGVHWRSSAEEWVFGPIGT